jgi:hypothetical protein
MNGQQLSRRLHIRCDLSDIARVDARHIGLILKIGTIMGLALQISTGALVIACLRNVSPPLLCSAPALT